MDGFNMFTKGTSASRVEFPGWDSLTFQLVDNPLYPPDHDPPQVLAVLQLKEGKRPSVGLSVLG